MTTPMKIETMKKGNGALGMETNGQCFFCLGTVASVKPEPHLIKNSPVTSSYASLHSLNALSRYLNMDMNKLLTEDVHGPISQSQVKNRRPHWKAELCDECSPINLKFLTLYQHLEKVQMEVTSLLQIILWKLVGRKRKDCQKSPMQINPVRNAKEGIKEALREAMEEACCRKLTAVPPRVKLFNMERTALNRKTLKLKNRSLKVAARLPPFDGQCMEGQYSFEDAREDEIEIGEYKLETPGIANADDEDVVGASVSYGDFVKVEGHHSSDVHNDNGSITAATAWKIGSENWKEEKKANDLSVSASAKLTRTSLRDKYTVNSESGKHACRDCGKEFACYNSFYVHHRLHHLGLRFECSICSRQFTRRGSLKQHNQLYHSGNNIPLRPSLPRVPAGSSRINHKTGKHDCMRCHQQFSAKSSFSQHFRAAHLNCTFNCAACSKTFLSRQGRREHNLIEHMKVKFKCTKCSKMFTRRVQLYEHIRATACVTGLDLKLNQQGPLTANSVKRN